MTIFPALALPTFAPPARRATSTSRGFGSPSAFRCRRVSGFSPPCPGPCCIFPRTFFGMGAGSGSGSGTYSSASASASRGSGSGEDSGEDREDEDGDEEEDEEIESEPWLDRLGVSSSFSASTALRPRGTSTSMASPSSELAVRPTRRVRFPPPTGATATPPSDASLSDSAKERFGERVVRGGERVAAATEAGVVDVDVDVCEEGWENIGRVCGDVEWGGRERRGVDDDAGCGRWEVRRGWGWDAAEEEEEEDGGGDKEEDMEEDEGKGEAERESGRGIVVGSRSMGTGVDAVELDGLSFRIILRGFFASEGVGGDVVNVGGVEVEAVDVGGCDADVDVGFGLGAALPALPFFGDSSGGGGVSLTHGSPA